MDMNTAVLKGTERALPSGAVIIGRANPQRTIQVTVHMRPANDRLRSSTDCLVNNGLRQRRHLTRQEFAGEHGIGSSDIQPLRRLAREFGLQLVGDGLGPKNRARKLGSRRVKLRGSVRSFSRAFGVDVVRVEDKDGNVFRTYVGPLTVPSGFDGNIVNVLGLDNRPTANPRSKPFPRTGGFKPNLGATSFNPDQIAKLYNFPSGVTGKGQTIAMIELKGGYRKRDLRTYFKQLGLSNIDISYVPAGSQNDPTGNPNGADSEVMLDIEVAGAVANGARQVVYFGTTANQGFLNAVSTAIHDEINQPSILSISWGAAESEWTASDMISFDEAFQAAAAMGISVFVAAGDDGSNDGIDPASIAHADFPGSSPYATTCGGTRLISTDGQTIAREVVWNDGHSGGTGGGVSDFFDPPFYQVASSVPPSANPDGRIGRGVPDVAGNADPKTGYNIRIDGVDSVWGGTSAVAPLWAGLTALLNESLGQPVGFLNPLLYSTISQLPGAMRGVLQGNNDTTERVGGYSARPGWDPCTGLGTPNGELILQALRQ